MKNQLVLGIDIGGTSTKLGLVTNDGQILAQTSIKTCETSEPIHFAKRLRAAVEVLSMAHGGLDSIRAAGAGAPNANYNRGSIEYAPNLTWKGIVPIAALLQEELKIPVSVTNDANAAALGEMKFGRAKGLKHFVAVTLGTGLGGGVVCDGKLVYGHSGFAGELGHMVAVRDGRSCNCGRSGCLEVYASATGIVRTMNEILKSDPSPSILRDKENITAFDIAGAARDGDPLALSAFEFTGKILGQSLADIAVVTSPQAIVLMGGLTAAGDLLFKPTRSHFEKNLLNIFQNTVEILPTGLRESEAAILGAAALAE